ncbi:MAG TPA: hypothetical protein VGU61_14490 [Noviherbaspirillum sp.]|jgi:major membrane immunogen (membrane-anchored lipoprotein)|uniref:hypothetical protein n=1 Tax=Noviherbaspirillum sp. TaxID=1926288 RepID=UPI002DDD1F6D|nr:hypothetical protein [Noviherbaspirillum sp.]HEV2611475.1 hypothetical protein [Noviherbaspirillum sp.]
MMKLLLASASLIVLAACGEKEQTTGSRGDSPPWQGTKNAYMEKGWTAGDKTAWETQLRTRSQQQNEYVKSN